MVQRCLGAASFTGAAVCAVQPSETVKLSAGGRLVDRTIDRRGVWLAQTPQAFRRQVLSEAFLAAAPDLEYTDEASMVEAAGHPVALVAGHPGNLKITTPEDLRLARFLLRGPGARPEGHA
jgi:2-C-methyl-D-erythritol 4-phosphate cytidylyltransferase/2-C-methyl-D-erythritol 2,4-cyclodiphosphate synthase